MWFLNAFSAHKYGQKLVKVRFSIFENISFYEQSTLRGPQGLPKIFLRPIFFNMHKMVQLEFSNHFGTIPMGTTPSTERGRWAQMIRPHHSSPSWIGLRPKIPGSGFGSWFDEKLISWVGFGSCLKIIQDFLVPGRFLVNLASFVP